MDLLACFFDLLFPPPQPTMPPPNPRSDSEVQQWAELVLPYLPLLPLATAGATSRILRRTAQSITARRVSDAARSLEPNPIPFLSPVDSEPYSYFLYSPSSLLPPSPSAQPWGGAGAPMGPGSDTAMSGLSDVSGFGCDCEAGCEGECPCKVESGVEVVRECGAGCRCGVRCGNRRTQGGVKVRLRVVKDRRKGWGLHAGELIKRGDFVCEYAGEFLTTEEARKRQQTYDKTCDKLTPSPALLVVREHLPSGKACLRVNIDATKIGNIARFINHSCDGGNLLSVLVRNSGSLLPRLCFFAAVDISEGQELTFSYGDARLKPNCRLCFCGTDACFGYLPSEDT